MQQRMDRENTVLQGLCCRCMKTACIMVLMLAVSGCGGLRGRTQILWKYTLEYTPPVVQGLTPVNEALQVKLFTVAQNYNSNAMVYQPEPFRLQQYQNSKWRVNPGDMVTDYMLRDLRQQKLFKAVFSYRESGSARFALEGEIEQFAEVDEKDSSKAVLSVYVTLLDSSQKGASKMVVCQKNYRVAELFDGKGPAAFAQAMSRAMEKFSRELAQDLQRGISAR
jgi:ABC-type uncharacterized transport system auxiliary subunit